MVAVVRICVWIIIVHKNMIKLQVKRYKIILNLNNRCDSCGRVKDYPLREVKAKPHNRLLFYRLQFKDIIINP
jgi:hypothetical protein